MWVVSLLLDFHVCIIMKIVWKIFFAQQSWMCGTEIMCIKHQKRDFHFYFRLKQHLPSRCCRCWCLQTSFSFMLSISRRKKKFPLDFSNRTELIWAAMFPNLASKSQSNCIWYRFSANKKVFNRLSLLQSSQNTPIGIMCSCLHERNHRNKITVKVINDPPSA